MKFFVQVCVLMSTLVLHLHFLFFVISFDPKIRIVRHAFHFINYFQTYFWELLILK